jgi:hypothetical protein
VSEGNEQRRAARLEAATEVPTSPPPADSAEPSGEEASE